MPTRNWRLAILLAVAVVAIVGVALAPPIPQPLGYHSFADTRAVFGVPNFWNVISNVPFLIVGVAGLIEVLRGKYPGGLPSLRFAYGLFF